MTVGWGVLAARARGLATRLPSEEALDRVTRRKEPADLVAGLAELGITAAGGAGDAASDGAALDRLLRRFATLQLFALLRWSAGDERLGAILWGEHEARAVRSLVRGAAAGAARESRLAGLIATPGLPELVLEELAAAAGPGAVVAGLAARRHSLGAALVEHLETSGSAGDLGGLDLALARAEVARRLAAARSLGREVEALVREEIDLTNLLTALTLAGEEAERTLSELFLDGGKRVGRELFLRFAASVDRDAARLRIAHQLAAWPPARRLASVRAVEAGGALLAGSLAAARRNALLRPLGPAPVHAFVTRLAAVVARVSRWIWSLSLGIEPAAG